MTLGTGSVSLSGIFCKIKRIISCKSQDFFPALSSMFLWAKACSDQTWVSLFEKQGRRCVCVRMCVQACTYVCAYAERGL